MYFVQPSSIKHKDILNKIIDDYANEMYKAGEFSSKGEAQNMSKQEVELALNMKSENIDNNIYIIILNGKTVGFIWYMISIRGLDNKSKSFLNYLYINKESRNQGMAKQALVKYESYIRKYMNDITMELYVFKDNITAQNLYLNNGYYLDFEIKGYLASKISRLKMHK